MNDERGPVSFCCSLFLVEGRGGLRSGDRVGWKRRALAGLVFLWELRLMVRCRRDMGTRTGRESIW